MKTRVILQLEEEDGGEKKNECEETTVERHEHGKSISCNFHLLEHVVFEVSSKHAYF